MYGAIAANKRNTFLIMAVFIGLISAIGYFVSLYFGNPSITFWVLFGSAIYALVQYYAASSLAVMATGAEPIKKKDNPRLYRIVENLSITNGMPMPKVYMIEDSAPNAFATGRDPNHAIVAATTGIMDLMTDRELEAVMAHEMGHVKNYDIRVSMIAFGLVAAIGLLADFAGRMMFFSDNRDRNVSPVVMIVGIVLVILAPVIAMLIQMAISRQREYLADATGAMTTRDPEGLASALEKLKTGGKPLHRQSTSTAHMFFANPLSSGTITNLFSTHPPLDERIKRLREKGDKF